MYFPSIHFFATNTDFPLSPSSLSVFPKLLKICLTSCRDTILWCVVVVIQTPIRSTMITLFVNNLNEKIKIEELKRGLYSLLSQYGPVLEIVAGCSMKKRGQAFIVFQEIRHASTGMQHLQGFPFFEHPMMAKDKQ